MGFRYLGRPKVFAEPLGMASAGQSLAGYIAGLPNDLIVWRDWSSAVYQDSGATTPATGTDPVGYWEDRSGNGYHATRDSDTTRPTLTTVNGKRALDFDGSNDYLHVALSESAGNWTWIFAIEPDDVPAGAGQYLLDIATGRLILAYASGSGSPENAAVYDGDWSDIAADISGVQILTFELIGGTTQAKVYRNGVQIGSAFTYTQLALGGANQALGAFNNGGGAWFDGRIIFELGVAGALSTTDFNRIHSLLAAELSLT